MKTPLRTISIYAALLACGLLFAGCPGGGKSKKKSQKQPKNPPTTKKPAKPVEYAVRIRQTGSARGTIEIQPPSSTGRYASGTRLVIVAIPDASAEFKSWSGGARGSKAEIKVTIGRDLSLVARFEYPEPERSARSAVEALLTAAPDPAVTENTLLDRVQKVAELFGQRRNTFYGPASRADQAYADQLVRCGETRANLTALENVVSEEVGEDEFLPGRTVSFKLLYSDVQGLLPNCDAAMHVQHRAAWLTKVRAEVRKIMAARELERAAIVPAQASARDDLVLSMFQYRLAATWALSDSRGQLFEQERLVYTTAAGLAFAEADGSPQEDAATAALVDDLLKHAHKEVLRQNAIPAGTAFPEELEGVALDVAFQELDRRKAMKVPAADPMDDPTPLVGADLAERASLVLRGKRLELEAKIVEELRSIDDELLATILADDGPLDTDPASATVPTSTSGTSNGAANALDRSMGQ